MDDMICNFKKCRKRLNTFAWITSCSHIFCDEDGTREFNKCLACPACDTNLTGKIDIVRIDLAPSDQYKCMVLAGHKPDTILEICTQAMALWTYQIQQERVYQDYVANKSKERTNQLEQYCEHTVTKLQSEIASLKNGNAALRKELESCKKRMHEMNEKDAVRTRQHLKLQMRFEALRRRSISVASLDPNAPLEGLGRAFDIHISSGDEGNAIPARHRGGGDNNRVISPAEKEFVFRPVHTPILNHDNVAAAFGASTAVQNRFNMELGTPNEITRKLAYKP